MNICSLDVGFFFLVVFLDVVFCFCWVGRGLGVVGVRGFWRFSFDSSGFLLGILGLVKYYGLRGWSGSCFSI